MIKCKFTMTGEEALRWRELLHTVTPELIFPDMGASDTYTINYKIHIDEWEREFKRAETVAFLLRNANITKLEFDEWDRGTGYLHAVARAHAVLNDLYSALEMCPEYNPPSQPPKGWWQKLKEWLW